MTELTQEDKDETLLIFAGSEMHAEIRKALASGANVNAKRGEALRKAAHAGQEKSCLLLLDHGADVTLAFETSYISCVVDHPEIARLLLRRGAPYSLWTALEGPLAFFVDRWADQVWDDHSSALADVLTSMRDHAEQTFPLGEGAPKREQCFAGNELSDALLDACVTGWFGGLVGAHLVESDNPSDWDLFREIWEALPECWRKRYSVVREHLDSRAK